jgi:hypothetical protein
MAAYGAVDWSSIPSVGRFLTSATCRLPMERKLSPIQWIQEALSPRINWPEREVHQSALEYVCITTRGSQ